MTDTTETILRGARKFFSGTALSRITGLGRDVAIAAAFGIEPQVAAFMLAFRLSHLGRRIFGEGALQMAFIPHFEELKNKEPKKSFHFFTEVTANISLLLFVLISFVMTLLGAALLFGNPTAANRDVLFLTLLMMPSLALICLYGLNASLLQCEGHFFMPAFAPVAFNIVSIVTVYLVASMEPSTAMFWMAISINMACLLQWLMTVPSTWRAISPHFELRSIVISFKRLTSLYAPFFLSLVGVVAQQINSAIDPLFARFAELDGPAILWYAIRLEQLPVGLFGIALASAVLPPLTRAYEQGEKAKFSHFLQMALQRNSALMVPIAVGLIFLGPQCVQLIYGHGDFGAEAIAKTSWSLWGYAVGVLPATLVLILAPAFYARKNYKVPMQAALLSVFSSTALNGFLIFGCHLGAASVAFSTSVSAFINVGYLLYHLRQEAVVKFSLSPFLWTGAVLFFALCLEWMTTGRCLFYEVLVGEFVTAESNFLNQIFAVVIPGSLFLVPLTLALFGKEKLEKESFLTQRPQSRGVKI